MLWERNARVGERSAFEKQIGVKEESAQIRRETRVGPKEIDLGGELLRENASLRVGATIDEAVVCGAMASDT